MDLQTYTKAGLLSAIMVSFSAYPLHTQVDSPGVERGEVCATILGSDFTACPQDFTHHALSMSSLPSATSECEASAQKCIDDVTRQVKKDYYTFFDVDNKQTVKYEITIHPNVYDPMGKLVKAGDKTAVEVRPTDHEVEATETLAEIAALKQSIAKKFTLEIDEDGNVTEATGHSVSKRKEKVAELCLTALDYTSNDVNCAGALNTAIDNAVASEAGFHALMSIENKSEHVIEIISPLNSDFATLKNRSTFRLINKFVDGSELALDVRKKGGVVEIVVNRDASFISDGRTFRHAEDYGTSSQLSLREAKRVATSQNIPKRCEQPTFDNTDWVVEEVITINYPDERTEVTNIYRQEDTYLTYLQC
ncbi:hypothetical protein EXU34_10635 [Alteromonas sp. ZYF713]|nr:hypothetical protein [Alteromonas sp. ZYF713]